MYIDNFIKMLKIARKSSLIGIGISLTFMLAFYESPITLYTLIGYIVFGSLVGFFISLTLGLVNYISFSNKNTHISLQIIITYILSFIIFYIIALPFAYIQELSKTTLVYIALGNAVASVMVCLFFANIHEKEKRIKLEQENKELAIIEERNRIARELHDSVSQNLFGINLNLNTLNYLLEHNPEKSKHMIKQLQEMIQEVQAEMRLMIYELKPLDLSKRGFLETIENLITLFKKRYNLVISFSLIGNEDFIDNEIQLTLYRIIQEALNNIVKHANASKIQISLQIQEDNIHLSIHDNGEGFNLEEIDKNNNFGIQGMEERIAQIKGKLLIESTVGEGTTIQAII